MTAAPAPGAAGPGWVMIYHQGLPVAFCPVAVHPDGQLDLACGDLAFEPRARLLLERTTAGQPFGVGGLAPATVEGSHGGGVRVRLEGPLD